MLIEWLGHSCFRLTLKNGLSVVTDPYDDKVGYALPRHPADIVTVSHEHFDHNYTAPLSPRHVLRGPGVQTVEGVKIEGFASFHDDAQGAKRGLNTMFLIEADDIRVLHLGDLGHDLTDKAIAAFGRVDVLLIPVGGVFTIDAGQAADLAKRIAARITVPMHYKTSALSFNLGECAPFTAAMGAAKALSSLDPETETAPVITLTPGMGL